jgi:hypothetical protein
MANVKISNLTAATTPVAGTEVLPIVQSGATVKVSIANLTAGRSVSATGLALAGSTSGTVTLAAKAVAGSTTFRLPAADGTSNQAMVTDGSGNLSFATIAATPGGSTTQVQYNNAGAFAGSANLTFNGSTLAVTGALNATASSGGISTLRQNSATGTGLTIIPGADTNYAALTINNAADSLNKIQMYGNGTAYFAGNLSVGGATPTTSGTGITFPATQSASTNANTLDDYEEGTWTPSLGGTATYNSQLGQYIKIGRQVTVTVILQVTTLGTGSTTTISGLPFATNATAISGNAVAKFTTAVNVIGLNALALDGSVTTIRFTYISASGASNTYDPALFGNSTAVYFSLTYIVN